MILGAHPQMFAGKRDILGGNAGGPAQLGTQVEHLFGDVGGTRTQRRQFGRDRVMLCLQCPKGDPGFHQCVLGLCLPSLGFFSLPGQPGAVRLERGMVGDRREAQSGHDLVMVVGTTAAGIPLLSGFGDLTSQGLQAIAAVLTQRLFDFTLSFLLSPLRQRQVRDLALLTGEIPSEIGQPRLQQIGLETSEPRAKGMVPALTQAGRLGGMAGMQVAVCDQRRQQRNLALDTYEMPLLQSG